MHLGYITIQGRGLIDDCLSEAVALMQAQGLRLSGTVRLLPVDHRAHPCDMRLQVLPDGPVHRISQALGAGSRGCRLDTGQIETLAAEVEARVAGSDLLVVNKFGKQECHGRGLRPAILQALDRAIPVIVGVNAQNEQEFLAFADAAATQLAADPRAILSWANAALNAGSPAIPA
jgi:hypothetical protein